MEFQTRLAALFSEEDAARHMARELMSIANRSRDAAAREKESLLAFLHGPMERHMHFEEVRLFDKLVEHGLGPEVQVAMKHHEAIRESRDALAAATDPAEVAQIVFDVARLMLHHTNFEGDYIYPELDSEDWRELMAGTVTPSEFPPPASGG
ncbi:MAG: hemerythrin domain-containing protein [Polyangiaceae bacterium]